VLEGLFSAGQVGNHGADPPCCLDHLAGVVERISGSGSLLLEEKVDPGGVLVDPAVVEA